MASRGRRGSRDTRGERPSQPANRSRLRTVVALVLSLALVGVVCGVMLMQLGNAGTAPQPNVLLISIDTLRPDHLGCYGYERQTSPRLDRLAAEGVLFENVISSTSWTLPAHAALFTSLVDSVHGCTDTNRRLPDAITTLAERFSASGYQTAGFFSGPYLHPAFGLAQGFDHYEDCTSYARLTRRRSAAQWSMDVEVMRQSHRDITSPTVLEAVRKWLDQGSLSPFFMFVHMWDVHFDFIPPAPYDTLFDPDYTGELTGENFFFDTRINAKMPRRDLEHLIALYDGEIAWTDHHLGLILDTLQSAGVLDNTVVAVTADHGTEFFEHGLKGHRTTLYDELTRVPLIIRYPPTLPAGSRIPAQARLIDIAPTLLDLAGVEPAAPLMGHTLVHLMRGEPPSFDNAALSELFSIGRRMRSIRMPNRKLVDDLARGDRYWMDLLADPAEQHPQRDFTQGPGLELQRRYESAVGSLDAWRELIAAGTDRSTIPDDVRRQLESLGYVEPDANQPGPAGPSAP